ncbi:MAG: heavy-metal-associated domain-containing protein [Lachnospiraceae bacterium]|nr:heavy-metal-associated domain-containing protein [Lachnospiraceae bacterium]
MENVIITIVLVVLLLIGIRATKKHFKRQGGCCGGSGKPTPIPEKKLDNVIARKVVVVEGMTCDHCKNWVEKSINNIDGAAAKVDLKKKEAVVSLAKDVSDEEIRLAIQKAGYKVVEIR